MATGFPFGVESAFCYKSCGYHRLRSSIISGWVKARSAHRGNLPKSERFFADQRQPKRALAVATSGIAIPHLKAKASKSKGSMKNSRRGRNGLCSLYLVVMATFIAETTVVRAESDLSVKRVAGITDELRQELGIPQAVDIQIVPSNGRAFSVEAVDRHTHFTISVDASFLRQLNDQELTAAVAHELGHVWIYTHHPFLHTEGLANEIALRVISKDSLRSLYDKLQQFESSRSVHGSLQGVLND
jgi:hypothetical protein